MKHGSEMLQNYTLRNEEDIQELLSCDLDISFIYEGDISPVEISTPITYPGADERVHVFDNSPIMFLSITY